MIVQIHGLVIEASSEAVLIQPPGGLTYEVLLPSFTASRLTDQQGNDITLHTLHFLESQNQGATMIPRLAGFLSKEDRAFFQLFTTCKGIGNRKALRALAMDASQIANAIADRDTATLQTLPEIGKRTAETIIATLHGKVDHFVAADALAGSMGADAQALPTGVSSISREATEVLMQLGETRIAAIAWINEALNDPDDRPEDVHSLVERVYRIKAGG